MKKRKKRNQIMTDYEGSVMLKTTLDLFSFIGKKIFFWAMLCGLLVLFVKSFNYEGVYELFSTKLMSLEIPAQINIIIIMLGVVILYLGKGDKWLLFALISLVSMFSFIIKFFIEFYWLNINTLYLFIICIILMVNSYTPFFQSAMEDPYVNEKK